MGKGSDAKLNIVSSVFGNGQKNIISWINKGYVTYINKEKALKYLRISTPFVEAQDNQELNSATKIVENFENPIIEDDFLYRDGDPEIHERELARYRYERRVKAGCNFPQVAACFFTAHQLKPHTKFSKPIVRDYNRENMTLVYAYLIEIEILEALVVRHVKDNKYGHYLSVTHAVWTKTMAFPGIGGI